MLEQLIPSEICLKCDVCCRFPDPDSLLAPFFTEDEIKKAVRFGLSVEFFKDWKPGRIRLIPFPDEVESPGHNGGCMCPSFDPVTRHCRIYSERPFDCQLYPFVVMRREKEIVLGMDTKCPFIREVLNRPAVLAFGDQLANHLESGAYTPFFAQYPELIGPYQEDVMILRSLKLGVS